MKPVIYLFLFSMPLKLIAQYEGVKFEEGVTWEQIKEKANVQHKIIFVDCFATWCKPCKEMEINVYSNDTVGAYLNSRFVSVKLQMDTGRNNNAYTKLLYPIAREFEVEYKIAVLPTYLFFSPDGLALHKQVGKKTVKQFLEILKEAENPNEQLYTLINKWRSNQTNVDKLKDLIKKLKEVFEDSLALDVARSYMHEYLDKLSDTDFCNKDNLIFLNTYGKIISSKDRAFKLYFSQSRMIDSIMSNKGYSKNRIINIISNEEIKPRVEEAERNGANPNWTEIERAVEKKYGAYYSLNSVIKAKEKWFYLRKDWKDFINTIMKKWQINRNEFQDYGWYYLNDIAWYTYLFSQNRRQLKTALIWINMAIPMDKKSNIAMLDTKASILYKLGKKKEAISIETSIIELVKSQLKEKTSENDKELWTKYVNRYRSIVDKMKSGMPL